jgi:hypothetical protein
LPVQKRREDASHSESFAKRELVCVRISHEVLWSAVSPRTAFVEDARLLTPDREFQKFINLLGILEVHDGFLQFFALILVNLI